MRVYCTLQIVKCLLIFRTALVQTSEWFSVLFVATKRNFKQYKILVLWKVCSVFQTLVMLHGAVHTKVAWVWAQMCFIFPCVNKTSQMFMFCIPCGLAAFRVTGAYQLWSTVFTVPRIVTAKMDRSVKLKAAAAHIITKTFCLKKYGI